MGESAQTIAFWPITARTRRIPAPSTTQSTGLVRTTSSGSTCSGPASGRHLCHIAPDGREDRVHRGRVHHADAPVVPVAGHRGARGGRRARRRSGAGERPGEHGRGGGARRGRRDRGRPMPSTSRPGPRSTRGWWRRWPPPARPCSARSRSASMPRWSAAMVDDVERAGVINQVGLVMRFLAPSRLVRHLIADPRAGAVLAVSFRDDQYLPIQGQYGSTWRADPALCGPRHDAGALDPRRRHAALVARPDLGAVGPHADAPRLRAHRRRGGGAVRLRVRSGGHPHVGVARHARAPERSPHRGAVRAAPRRGRG